MPNLSLHPLWHTVMPAYQHTLGLITQMLSAVALYLMITKTTERGRPFARYLILLQVRWLGEKNGPFWQARFVTYPHQMLLF